MRLNRLDLIRYGKFTGQSVSLPQAPRDFHLILGANEAGKSTLRSAILDLLFGFPLRTPLDFLHQKSDLCVGAQIQHGDGMLEFVRLKANKNTLRAPDGEILPDTVLDAFLGGAGRGFFDKMFGLDHPRLVEGGNSILNAQDDVGQVLFQSAAGLASLGRVRDALEQEADSLWAPTRSSKRAYYQARDDMAEASAALKAATVRTGAWTDAHERVQALTERIEAQRAVQLRQQAQRNQLERIRRVNPVMQELRESEAELAGLGQVVSLAPDAAQTLAQAERAQAMAEHGLDLRRAEAQRLEAALAGIAIDDTLLAMAGDIEALDALRHQYGAHESAMVRCQGQLDQLWKEALQWLDELGMAPRDVTDGRVSAAGVLALQARLPGLPVRKHLEQLLRDQHVAGQALHAAQAAASSRRAEVAAIEAKLRAQPAPVVNAALRAALERAKTLGDPDAALQKSMALVRKAQSALDQALANLGEWSHPPGPLRTLAVPLAQVVAELLPERRVHVSDVKSAGQRCDELAATAEKARLRVQQYRELHHPATQEDVMQARLQRDEIWRSIKRGDQAVAAAATQFESQVGRADALADSRHEKAQEAAQMQSLQHQWEQASQDLELARARQSACQKALADLDARWRAACDSLGLAGMPLEHAPDWLAQKDRVLDADEALVQAQHDTALLQDALQTASDRLAQTLAGNRGQAEGDAELDKGAALTLDGLRAKAEATIRDADAAIVRREAWLAQLAELKPVFEAAQQALHDAQARQANWQQAWTAALTQAGLAPHASLGEAEGALALISAVADKLEQMRRLRAERLDVMQAELDSFTEQAGRYAQTAGLAAGALSHAEAFSVSQTLMQRLAEARRAQEQAAGLKRALEGEQAEIRVAEQALRQAQANVQPLLDRAGVRTLDALAQAIGRSDQHRALQERIRLAQARLLQEGDGLTREQLQAEREAVDPAAILTQWTALQADLEQSSKAQSDLAVELAEARRDLDAMAGADTAARAEARRQDALARMGDAAERYVKVFTAARLLRWSIDRYREEKQGPMLARASAIYAQLTLNSFERLRVDFDRHPMVLEGQRADGQRVGIGGMSDGTRDQLYLALRLAALELHLQQAPALPFIADDLFINYDDARSEAGLRALADLSEQTQVVFLSHHGALLAPARRVFGDRLNVVTL
ncbi:AAA family ATPase [Pusillimonas sp. SM2304]|uniref:ATP-binding protein n=1 Tax=Pusillimonas sp. SM2304 TaxID=3073241 RepID=UPI00287428C0|nr:AAA family ATPase [Pusillimonas sp. SM2304]MDS1141350.1 AAA family ATPase [Pusillimonas sp. SM2304]